MQAFPNYNYKTFPYVLIKDTQSLNVINVKTMQSRVILDNSPYSWAGVQSSLMDFKVDQGDNSSITFYNLELREQPVMGNSTA